MPQPDSLECPLCGETMRRTPCTEVVRIPGTSESRTRVQEEWVCPECDYFQEVNPDLEQ
jgi:hypothetical protein